MFRLRAALAALIALVQLSAPWAHGHGSHRAAGWTELCTAEGLRRVPSADEPAPVHDGDEHCALCRLADVSLAPPPPAPATVTVRPAADRAAVATATFVRAPTAHDAAARAPPYAPA